MTTRDSTEVSENEKIWAQLDAEDAGRAPAHEDETSPIAAEESVQHAAPALEADAPSEPAQDQQSMMDKIAGLESMLTQVTGRLRNAEGHIGGLNSQLKQQQQVASQVAARGGDAPSAAEVRSAQSNPQAMASLKRDYPEFADAMESALNERLSAVEQRIAQQPAQQVQQGVTAEQIHQMRREFSVEVRHPGWQERVKAPEFAGWLQRQSREVQLLAQSDNTNDAIRLLDLHSDASKATTTQRTRRLDSAAAIPSGRSGSSVRQKPVEDMTPQEYWRYLDETDKPRR